MSLAVIFPGKKTISRWIGDGLVASVVSLYSKKSQKGKRACCEFPNPPEFSARFLSYAAMVFTDRGTADGIMEIYIYIYIRYIYIYIYIRGIFLRKDIVHCSENMSRVSLCSSLQFAFRTPVSTTMRKLHDALLVSNFLHPYYH